MPYNLDLEYRVEKLAPQLAELNKMKMFGGIAYLINGNMCFAIHKKYLIVRTSVKKADELLNSESIKPFDITGKVMKGWLRISPNYLETDEKLFSMLKLEVNFAKNLPRK